MISLNDIYFGLFRQCYESSHGSQKALIEKYEVSDKKQESLNEVTNRWNISRIKGISRDPDIWFNELFNSNLKFKKIKAKYKKNENELKEYVFSALPEYYKPVRVSCNNKTSNMVFKEIKKGIHWFWNSEFNGNKTQ